MITIKNKDLERINLEFVDPNFVLELKPYQSSTVSKLWVVEHEKLGLHTFAKKEDLFDMVLWNYNLI